MKQLRTPTFIQPLPNTVAGRFVGEIPQEVLSAESARAYTDIAVRLDRSIEALEGRVRVNPLSRIMGWREAIARLQSADHEEVIKHILDRASRGEWKHDFRPSFLAIIEAQMVIVIVENLLDVLTDRDLREIVSGHPDPAFDSSSARGRDKQFEWYIAAVLRRGGLPIALAEPDILIDFNGVRAIAAKRVSSRRQFASNIKKASSQIAAWGHPGYICVDLTRLLDPGAQFMEHWRDDGKAVQRRLDPIAAAVGRWGNEMVHGVYFHTAFPLISRGPAFGSSEHWMSIPLSDVGRSEHLELARLLVAGRP